MRARGGGWVVGMYVGDALAFLLACWVMYRIVWMLMSQGG